MPLNTAHLQTLNDAADLIKIELVLAQKAFNKLPNSTNWQVCLRVMFAHQQMGFAIRSHTVDREKLAFDLTANPRGEWQNIICRATLGLGMRDCIQEFAVF
jgi:hypothetical protein